MKSSLNFLSGGNGPLVKKLLGCVQYSENGNTSSRNHMMTSVNGETGETNSQWVEKVVKSIVKKIKKNPGAAETLERAITNRDSSTECVTLPRSHDGRVQFSQRKVLPHLLSTRLWRWPDIENQHELKAIESCEYAFHLKKEEICINPYHYHKIASISVPPILVPRGVHLGDAPLIPLDRPPLDDFLTFVPNNADMPVPSSPSESVSSSSSFPSCSPPPDYMSENESMDQDVDQRSIPASPSSVNGHAIELEPVEYKEPDHWCTVHYYEMNARVGDAFQATVRDISIDGYTDPSNASRFCLGLLSNCNRTQAVEMARRHIGKGLRLYYIGGEVYAECESNAAIFIQSPNANQNYGWHPATVVKIPPGCHFKIFSNNLFAQLLRHSVSDGYEAAFQLTRMCTIRVSLVKGWGTDYRRQTVMSTPCWIELHLNGPLQWLDKVLKQMQGPEDNCTSVS